MNAFTTWALLDFGIGVLAGVIGSYLWDIRARYLAHENARKLAGTWVAYDIHGRAIDAIPMPGAGVTVISSRPRRWTADSAVLDVRGQDAGPSSGHARVHGGHIVLDTVIPGRATRTVRYDDSDEISEQRLEISPDSQIIYVFPVAPRRPSVMHTRNTPYAANAKNDGGGAL